MLPDEPTSATLSEDCPSVVLTNQSVDSLCLSKLPRNTRSIQLINCTCPDEKSLLKELSAFEQLQQLTFDKFLQVDKLLSSLYGKGLFGKLRSLSIGNLGRSIQLTATSGKQGSVLSAI